MAQIINLRQVKKQAARKAARSAADANAAKFGQSKSDRAAQARQADKAVRDLDGHRRETDGD